MIFFANVRLQDFGLSVEVFLYVSGTTGPSRYRIRIGLD
jgi:hypothetical protein